MRLDAVAALRRLEAHDHGVLGTSHPERGVDAVPCVYVVVDDIVGVPIDRVKPKASAGLQRERNLSADPRATLLIEHWDAQDWTSLWWVRAGLRWLADPTPDEVERSADRLAAKYPPYRDRPFHRVLVFELVELTGWTAEPKDPVDGLIVVPA